jgi:hypothetical protein
MRLSHLTTTLLAAVLTASACSSGTVTASPTITPTPAPHTTVPGIPGISSTPGVPGEGPTLDPALLDAVQGYSDAYLSGDADTAYAYLSARCQTALGHDEFTTDVEAAANSYGEPLPFQVYKASEFGGAAYVTYTYKAAPEINARGQLWTRDDGTWHYDAC